MSFEHVEGLAMLARWGFGAGTSAMEVSQAKLDGSLVAKVAQDEPKNGQEGPGWPEKGPKTYEGQI